MVVGGNLHEMTTPRERVFLFARALKVASNHLAPALRARPEELDAALLALLQGHEASRAQKPEPRQMQDLRKKLLKAVPRRWRDEVESLVLELRGNAGFSTRAVPFAIAELGRPRRRDPNRGRSLCGERAPQNRWSRRASQRCRPPGSDSGNSGGVGGGPLCDQRRTF